jgi:hypothetical protein
MTAIHETHVESVSPASGASLSEAMGGIVAIILTILGLAHVAPTLLVAVATIAVGVALAFQGGVIATAYAHLISQPAEQKAAVTDLGGGTAWSIEFLAGAAGIVLGILALLQVAPTDLVAIAAIAFGGALVLSSTSAAQVNVIKLTALGLDESAQRAAGGILSGAAGVQAIAGLEAIVLGILALAGFNPVVLVLVALLGLGSFILVNGSAMSGTMLAMFRR